MTLMQNTLQLQLLNVFNDLREGRRKVAYPQTPPHPSIPNEVCAALTEAYDNWVVSSVPMAGALTVVSPGLKSALQSLLAMPLLAGFGPGFAAYWSPVIFAGPGFIPTNPVVPISVSASAAGLSADILKMINSRDSPMTLEEVSLVLSKTLYSWTTKLQVLATTTSAPPVASVLPVS
jgi:hypothetical protein